MPTSASITAFALASLAQQRAVKRCARRHARARTQGRREPDVRDQAVEGVARSATQRVGARYEACAVDYLEAAGLHLLARNLLCASGEIDIVMREGAVLVFVEVRGRRDRRFGGAAASVTLSKQLRLRRAAATFLPQLCRKFYGGRLPVCRFDVVAFDDGQLQWVQDAFHAR
jgi:putative endonuclease